MSEQEQPRYPVLMYTTRLALGITDQENSSKLKSHRIQLALDIHRNTMHVCGHKKKQGLLDRFMFYVLGRQSCSMPSQDQQMVKKYFEDFDGKAARAISSVLNEIKNDLNDPAYA